MAQTEFNIYSEADQTPLAGYIWSPDGAPKAVVQISHGLAEHAQRYKRFAEYLNALGYVVYAHDHRGHGRSIPLQGSLGNVGEAGWKGLVDDVAQVNRMIAHEHPDIPKILFGHSLGSFSVQQYLLDHSNTIDAAVLSGSTDIAMVAEMVAATGEAPSFDTYNAAFAPNRTAFDWLSRDEFEVDLYVDDPLCGGEVDGELTVGLIGAAPALGDAARLAAIRNDIPILILAGDEDPLNANLALLNSLVEKYKSAGLKRVETKFYKGGRHEMLNETNRDEVHIDISDWFARSL